jgi:hypothetical protein
MNEGLRWESVTWRRGQDEYKFDIERGGLFATFKAPGNRSMTLPMVALKANRATKAKTEQMFPVRSGSRWYEGEAAELAQGYRAGRSIPVLAKAHNRTEYAVENQLDKMGLFSKAEKYGPGTSGPRGRAASAAEDMAREIPVPSSACAPAYGAAVERGTVDPDFYNASPADEQHGAFGAK